MKRAIKEYIRHSLTEGRKERYLQMFQDITKWFGTPWISRSEQEIFEEYFNGAIEKLKREDRIIWFFRYLKHKMYDFLLMDYEFPEREKYLKKYESLFGNKKEFLLLPTIERIYQNTLHYLSLPVYKIQEYSFAHQHPSKVFEDLSEFEEEWKEAQKGFVSLSEYEGKEWEEVIRFPDGKVWILLNEESCDIEGEAMGHCGNAGDPQDGDRILSLRTFDEERQGWHFHLTFILKENNWLGEMKGRGNDKPAEKYHPYIIKLLQHPLINGIEGGGFLPQNNFELSDIQDKSVVQALIAEKPMLMGIKEYLKNLKTDEKVDKSIKSRIKEKVSELFNDDEFYDSPDGFTIRGNYVVFMWTDLGSFISSHFKKRGYSQEPYETNAYVYYSMIYGYDLTELYDIPEISENELIEEALKVLDIEQIKKILVKNEITEDEYDYYLNDKDSLIELISYDLDVSSIIRDAYQMSYESGSNDAAKNALERWTSRYDVDVEWGLESSRTEYSMTFAYFWENYIEEREHIIVDVDKDAGSINSDMDYDVFKQHIKDNI